MHLPRSITCALLALFPLCTASLTLVAGRARAQVNAETLAEAITKPGLGGAGKSTFAYAGGNVALLDARGELSTYFATAHSDAPEGDEQFWFRDRILAYGSAGVRISNHERVANDGYGHLRYTRMHFLRFGSEVFAQAQYDQFRLLQRRILLGAGLRVVFANYHRFRGWLGTGALVELERRDIAPEHRPPLGPDEPSMINPRSSSYVTLIIPIVPKLLSLIDTAYVQPRWDRPKDVQILEEAKLQIRVTDHFALTTDLSVRFDSRAPQTVKRTDTRIGNGLAFTF